MLFNTYNRFDATIEHGEGSYIYDTEGNRYLDFATGVGALALGHCHPSLTRAVETQLSKHGHISNNFHQLPQKQLAQRLIDMTGFDRVFYTNSGTEATEGAMKFARKFGVARDKSKTRILAMTDSFHGRTFGAMSLTYLSTVRKDYDPMLPDVGFVRHNDPDDLLDKSDGAVCALFLETVQGAGGLSVISDEMVGAINECRKRDGFLVVSDEIQAGLGRTGRVLSSDDWDIHPDIVTLAKAIGGGLPLGVVLGREKLSEHIHPGDHGTTFGGNPIACAAGLAFLEELSKPGFLEDVRDKGNLLWEALNSIAVEHPDEIRELRGLGMMLGFVVRHPASEMMFSMFRAGLATTKAAGNVLRFLPPLNVSEEEIEEGVEIIRKVLSRKSEGAELVKNGMAV